MSLQKKILKLLLWSLALAGVAGAGAVLLGGDEVAVRVMFTALITAIAAAFMLPQAKLLDRDATRSAALLGITLVIVIFLLALIGIWGLGGKYEEELWMTTLVIVIPSACAMVCLRMQRVVDQRLAARAGLVCSPIIFVMYLLAVWGPNNRWYYFVTWEMAGSFTFYSALSVVCLGRAKFTVRDWRWLGVIAAFAGFAIAAHEIVTSNNVAKIPFILATTIAIVIAHANLVLQAPLKSGQKWLSTSAIGLMVIAALLVDIVWVDVIVENNVFTRLAGAASIVAACASLAIGVLARINRGVDAEPGAFEMVNINMTCPRCQKKQTLPLGASRCGHCDLRIHVRVEEPRCAECGYLLYKLTSDTCPECGTMIQA